MKAAHATLAEAVEKIGELHPENGFTFQDLKGAETTYSFPHLAELTAHRAAGLQAEGLKKGDRIGLIVVEPEDFVITFLAAVRVGIIPVPLYPPLSLGGLDAYAEKTAKILDCAGAKILVASAQLQNVLWGIVGKVPSLDKLLKVETLAEFRGTPEKVEVGPDDIAFLQYTSGSTSDPKGVIVTHASLKANSEAIMGPGLNATPEKTVGVSWLPLYHDMGLIGFVVAPMFWGVKVVFIPTLRFLKRTSVWMETIHRHRGTISFAPPFAFALAARKAKPSDLEKWDLSCVEVLGCGAEPINAEAIRHFNEVFGPGCGLPKTAVLPAYGMAEATLAISLKPLRDEMKTLVVDAEAFQEEGKVVAANGGATIEQVACGSAFPEHEISVKCPEKGEVLGEGLEGEICVKGPSVTPGYFENPTATAATFKGGWLHTGDLGFIKDGQVYVTGRLKDLIILNGRNIHPQTLEWAAAEVDGVRRGNVVAFSRMGDTTEEAIVVLETTSTEHDRIAEQVKAEIQRSVGVPVAEVICVGRGILPKTSSGKLQRRRTRQQFLTGKLGTEGNRVAGSRAGKVTLARHVARSLITRARAAAPSFR
ncbi:MAG: fatty acyl-AMP ligase [Deltaproteobacteria bacterium]|nr:fatty acyl-AMP ligase [Deltaproteobacteria bacterium]